MASVIFRLSTKIQHDAMNREADAGDLIAGNNRHQSAGSNVLIMLVVGGIKRLQPCFDSRTGHDVCLTSHRNFRMTRSWMRPEIERHRAGRHQKFLPNTIKPEPVPMLFAP